MTNNKPRMRGYAKFTIFINRGLKQMGFLYGLETLLSAPK